MIRICLSPFLSSSTKSDLFKETPATPRESSTSHEILNLSPIILSLYKEFHMNSILRLVIYIKFTGKIDKEKVQQEKCRHSAAENRDKTSGVGDSCTEVQQVTQCR